MNVFWNIHFCCIDKSESCYSLVCMCVHTILDKSEMLEQITEAYFEV